MRWLAAALVVALASIAATWLWFDDWLLALIAGPGTIKLVLGKVKLACWILVARLQWFTLRHLPKRALRILLWIAAGTKARQVVRQHRTRAREALTARRRVLILAGLGALAVLGLSYLWLGIAGLLLLLPAQMALGLAWLVRYLANWLWSWVSAHGGTWLAIRLGLPKLVPPHMRRQAFRQMLRYRARAVRSLPPSVTTGADRLAARLPTRLRGRPRRTA